jgi:uncharacterized membrane protein HdeD (DUF308 family)
VVVDLGRALQLGRDLLVRPNVGAITVALLFGLFSLIYGISEIMLGAELRRTGKTRRPILQDAT